MFDVIDSGTQKLFEDIYAKHPISEYGIEFTVIFAYGDAEKDKAAISKYGSPASYDVKIYNGQERLLHNCETHACIILDGDDWSKRADENKEAVIYGALSSVEVKLDKNDEVVLDEYDMIKLKKVKPDIIWTGNTILLEKYGTESEEYKTYKKLQRVIEELL
jgi:hypothetical protein